jgi:hypothetical protein
VSPALPVKPSALACIVAFPFFKEVARPEALTDATSGLVLIQVTAPPPKGLPFLSRTWAENCWVRPTASRVALPGVTTIREGTGAEVESPPHDPRNGRSRRRTMG